MTDSMTRGAVMPTLRRQRATNPRRIACALVLTGGALASGPLGHAADPTSVNIRLEVTSIDVGDLPAGPQPVLVTIGAGEPNAVMVRMVRSGKKLSY